MSEKKNYVLDTSVYLTEASSIFKFGNNDIFIPLKVLEEVDKHKKRQDSVGSNARYFIRILDDLRARGSLQEGVNIGEELGTLRVMSYACLKDVIFPPDLDIQLPDHTIIATAKAIQATHTEIKTVVVSRDINMRVICDSIGIAAEDYISEKAVRSLEEIYNGFTTQSVDEQIIDRYYSGEEIQISAEEADEPWYPNQYIMMVSNSNEKKSALSRFESHYAPLKRVIHKSIPDWNIAARNKEQAFAIDLLMDPTVKIVTLVGRAGSGKTLCAIAAGLQQTIGLRQNDNHYSRIIISRPVQPLGRDIGFLPGTMEEKMLPWLSPIQEVEALTYIRGRSIANAYMVIDEAQNLTKHEVKTIITRIGEGTKIVLTGDIEQIDNVYVSETSNGLVHAVEKFKEHRLSGHVTFRKGERSELATLASKVL